MDERGYYKISVGGNLSEPLSKGWKGLGVDKATGAEGFTHTKADAKVPYIEVGVRRRFGGVILTVSQRRAPTMDATALHADMLRRFQQLVANAQDNQLFGKLVLILRSGGQEQVLDPSEPLPVDVSEAREPRRFPMKLMMVDWQNRPITYQLKRLSLEPTGSLADFVSVEGQGVQQKNRRYYIEDSSAMDFDLVVQPATGQLQETLIRQFVATGPGGSPATLSGNELIRLRLGVKYGTDVKFLGFILRLLQRGFSMLRMRTGTATWIAAALTAAALATTARAEDLDGDDLTQNQTVQPIFWEPILTKMYMTTDQPADFEKQPAKFVTQGQLPGLVAGWRALKPLITPRGVDDPPYGPTDTIVCAFKQDFAEGGGYLWHPDPHPDMNIRMYQTLSEKPIKYFYIGHDVLMTAEAARKDDLLKRFFRVTRWSLNLYRLTDQLTPEALRVKGPGTLESGVLPGEMVDDLHGDFNNNPKMVEMFQQWNRRLDNMRPGIYEVRSVLALRGRCSENEPVGPE